MNCDIKDSVSEQISGGNVYTDKEHEKESEP